MRRILVFVVVAVLALAMAVPAFAASDNASCVGQAASNINGFVPGLGGKAISRLAQPDDNGLVGLVADVAKAENCEGVLIPE
jgi:hypothetical protein